VNALKSSFYRYYINTKVYARSINTDKKIPTFSFYLLIIIELIKKILVYKLI
jgi:hypothetical protein